MRAAGGADGDARAGTGSPLSTAGLAAPTALARELEARERALQSPQVRGDRQQLAALLDEAFSEIGSSGRCFDRAAVLQELPAQRAQVVLESAGYTVQLLAEGLAQVRYRSRYHLDGQPQRWVLRSSLWRCHAGHWRLLFHQGTPEG